MKMSSNKQSPIQVSVIMATYNRYDTLPRAIDSVLAQTLKDFEFIIVDDGSTDNTGKLLQEYAIKDSRIKVITQENQGLAISRNNGVAQAQGKYIAFIDSDDACAINRLELQVGFLDKNPDIHATTCDCLNIATDFTPGISGELGAKVLVNNSDVYESRGLKGILGPTTTITRESFLAIGGYRPHTSIIEDLDFTLRYSRKYKWTYIHGSSIFFYSHPIDQESTGLSNSNVLLFTQRHIACYISAWHMYKNLADPIEEEKSLEDILATTRLLPLKDKHLIFKGAGHLFKNIAITQKITIKQAMAHVLDLLNTPAIFKHCILIWMATKATIRSLL